MKQNSLRFSEDKTLRIIGLPLTSDAKILLVVLDEITGEKDFCCPSLSALSDLMGCSEHRARKSIRETQSKGFLDVDRLPSKTNSYRIEWDSFIPIESESLNVNQYL